MRDEKKEIGRGIRVDGGVFLTVAVLALFVPLRWLAAALLAAAVHELGHLVAVCALGGRVQGMRISTAGAKMYASALPASRELLCVLAGPAASGSLLLLYSRFPRLALCGLVQGIYNLLPIGSFDGARAAKIVADLCKNRWNFRV